VILNLTFLGVFKYYNFFAESLAALLGAVHVRASLPVLNVILPVGISFYTFMSLSYTIDVYRGDTKPARSFLDYALFVAFFPHLVSGPIVRDTVLIPQLQQPRTLTSAKLQSGALLVLIGLARKFAADYLAADVDAAFSHPTAHGASTLLVAVFMFSLQIYGDFAGYTDIARGISRMMGIELVKNFDHPYFSTNITAFWRRWHMSLSSWLRDYLYIPLGGNRGSAFFGYRNLMLTMLLGGLWHGASWNFVVWGGLHGLALSVHKLALRGRAPEVHAERMGPRQLAGFALTMAWVALAWVFFRAQTFADALHVIGRITHLEAAPEAARVSGSMLRHALVSFAVLMAIDLPQARAREETVWLRWPWPVRALLYAAVIVTLVLIRTSRDVPFIYFQF
jgi:D-alanyl-lipoteichoic acid acyltransferase DltB (MBOAT superfamily)